MLWKSKKATKKSVFPNRPHPKCLIRNRMFHVSTVDYKNWEIRWEWMRILHIIISMEKHERPQIFLFSSKQIDENIAN